MRLELFPAGKVKSKKIRQAKLWIHLIESKANNEKGDSQRIIEVYKVRNTVQLLF